jgi:site-specific DNA-methyltransferase (adenine-specific)
MRPYYEHAGIVIYHGDCLEVMPQLSPVSLVLTDPPYVGLSAPTVFLDGGVAPRRAVSATVGDRWDANLDWTVFAVPLATHGLMAFCSFHFVAELKAACDKTALRPLALLTLHKRNAPNAVQNVPRYTTEFIWCFKKHAGLAWRNIATGMFDIPFPSAGCVSTGERFTIDGLAEHPTQKPLSLLMRLLAVAPESVLDPFMGTGTTLDAAKRFGIAAIGIEIEERYCEIAATRLSQEVLPFAEMSDAQ